MNGNKFNILVLSEEFSDYFKSIKSLKNQFNLHFQTVEEDWTKSTELISSNHFQLFIYDEYLQKNDIPSQIKKNNPFIESLLITTKITKSNNGKNIFHLTSENGIDNLKLVINNLCEKSFLKYRQCLYEEIFFNIHTIDETNDLPKVLFETCKSIIHFTKRIKCCIFLHDLNSKEEGQLVQYPIFEEDHPVPLKIFRNQLPNKKNIIIKSENDYENNPLLKILFREKFIYSVIVYPLIKDKKTIGAIYLCKNKKQIDFFEEEFKILDIYSRALLAKISTIERYRERSILKEIGDELNKNLSNTTREILKSVYKKLLNIINIKNIFFAIYEKETGSYSIPYFNDIKDTPGNYSNAELEKGLTGYVGKHMKPIFVSEEKNQELQDKGEIKLIGKPAKVWLGAPLISGDDFYGVIAIQDYENPNEYSKNDLHILEIIASETALILKNKALMRLKDRYINELTIINEILKNSSNDIGTKNLFESIVHDVTKKLECSHCTLFLAEKVKNEIRIIPKVSFGENHEKIFDRYFLPGKGLAGHSFQEEKELIVPDVFNHPKFEPARDSDGETRSMLLHPIKVRDKTIGVISLDKKGVAKFHKDDLEFVSALCLNIAATIEKEKLLEKIQEIGNKLALNKNVKKILEYTAKETKNLFNCAEVVVITSQFDSREYLSSLKKSTDKISKAILSKLSIYIFEYLNAHKSNNDIYTLDYIVNKFDIDLKKDIKYKSMHIVPLTAFNRIEGVLFLFDNLKRIYTAIEKNILLNICSLTAMSLMNAKTNDAQRKKTRCLELIKELHKTEDESSLMKSLLFSLNSICKFDTWYISEIDHRTNRLIFIKFLYKNKYINADIVNNRICGPEEKVIKTGETLFIEDLTANSENYINRVNKQHDSQSWLGIPIKSPQNKTISIFSLQFNKAKFLSSETIHSLETIAYQLYIALKRIQLLKKEKDLRLELEYLNKAIIAISKMDGIKEICNGILDGISEFIEYKSASIQQIYLGKRKLIAGKGFDLDSQDPYLTRPINKDKLIKRIIEKRAIEIIPDVTKIKDWDCNCGTSDVKSWICIPLVYHEEVVGIITIDHNKANYYNQSSYNTLSYFSERAALEFGKTLKIIKTQNQKNALQRLVSLNEITGKFLHNIKQNLSPVPLLLESIRNELANSETNLTELKSNINIIESKFKNVNEIYEIVKTKIVEKDKEQERESFDLIRLIDNCLNMIRIKFADNAHTIDYSFSPSSNSMIIKNYRAFYKEIFINLFDNSIEAMLPKKGKLSISVNKSMNQYNNNIEVKIVDTGKGIPEEELPFIYSLDYSKSEKIPGFGYGLYITKLYCAATGTDIDISSVVNKGTKITLTIPNNKD